MVKQDEIVIIGPFSEMIGTHALPARGPLKDSGLEILKGFGIAISGNKILNIQPFDKLTRIYPGAHMKELSGNQVLLPGFIDCHTHICWAGSRASDYAMRSEGKSYLEIAEAGGGIWSTVTQTRKAGTEELAASTLERAETLLRMGITTIEVKSGYGLNTDDEIKILTAIKRAAENTAADLIPTCLAAHMRPRDFKGSNGEYLSYILDELLPVVYHKDLSRRVDIFIERSAFTAEEAVQYLNAARAMGFDLTVHADQFSTGGSMAAVTCGARSADHLEASGDKEIKAIAGSDTVAVVLPGASIGLGMGFAPARKLLDAGACVAIASDWNPGSAPMGDLLTQAAILGASEKLSFAEIITGMTSRAAKALGLSDRGVLVPGMLADMQSYDTADHRDILYHQGRMKPINVWKSGKLI